MSTAELKLKLELINKITELKEIRIIKELKKLLDFELDEEIFELSKKQKNRIMKARKEYTNGETFTNDEVENEIEQWLNEK
ncbi:hypothetical protein MTP09_06055 [Chryseobacterium suipulveris]|uniref:Addiction module protein n=1 Tax=Chryseobacterium suipulveris TaxID=2929800 RepID=A0ABY4BSM7_9FLAO|nr:MULTISPECIES: hypothetical protein [Chryseobacterium]QIG88661.1 hypothetical protein G6R40_02805 [Chryseobacterium sp. POL2]UOE42198.1 hypothetical protein MTP09_06055 [Chryseobacterium suipulveris]